MAERLTAFQRRVLGAVENRTIDQVAHELGTATAAVSRARWALAEHGLIEWWRLWSAPMALTAAGQAALAGRAEREE